MIQHLKYVCVNQKSATYVEAGMHPKVAGQWNWSCKPLVQTNSDRPQYIHKNMHADDLDTIATLFYLSFHKSCMWSKRRLAEHWLLVVQICRLFCLHRSFSGGKHSKTVKKLKQAATDKMSRRTLKNYQMKPNILLLKLCLHVIKQPQKVWTCKNPQDICAALCFYIIRLTSWFQTVNSLSNSV